MLTLTQAIATYSYASRPVLATAVGDSAPDDAAALAQIDALLTQAAADYAARRYWDAVSEYQQAQSLIYAHLDPQWRPGLGGLVDRLPTDGALFDALLSATSQWLNVLPVPGPPVPVQPESAVDRGLLGPVGKLGGTGLLATMAGSAQGADALAAVSLASVLARQGNAAAAASALERAGKADASTAERLSGALGLGADGQPVAPPAPAAPAPAAPGGVLHLAPAQPAVPAMHALGAGGLNAATHALTAGIAGGAAVDARSVLVQPAALTVSQVPQQVLDQRSVGLLSGTLTDAQVSVVTWAADGVPDTSAIKTALYSKRVALAELPDVLLRPGDLADRAVALPHDYYYVIPLGLAECYHMLGDFPRAETLYLQAAGYQFINTDVEGPFVWQRLATLYLDWGNSLYLGGDAPSAATVYEHVLTIDTKAPATPLYTVAGLATAAGEATTLIGRLPAIVADPSTVDPGLTAIALVLVEVYQKLAQIAAGLDYFGHWAPSVPIWTFDYLQQVAVGFAQLAQAAERDVINFWDRADQATLTRTELAQHVDESAAEINAAQAQRNAAARQRDAYQAGLDLANLRATNSQQDADEYAATNSHAIILSALAQQVGGGDDGDWQQLDSLADQMIAGGTFEGSRGTLAAASQLAANRVSQQYQVDSMHRTAQEMAAAATQAQAELAAGQAQVAAADANVALAQLRAGQAAQTLAVFDADTFTPDVWHAMGDAQMRVYRRYLDMALRAARMMQRAYNFENDRELDVISPSYSADEIRGLLAADVLMADIQSFTDDMLTQTRSKKQLVRCSIRLADRYGYLFETQLRATGSLAFETRVEDFDWVYPGTYAGRIRRVEVAVEGIVPPAGISGTLTNAGLSSYRLPSDAFTPPAAPTKVRVQSAETLVLSDYDPQSDLVDTPDTRASGIFAGAGVASSWQLDLPRSVNDLDYGAITDVVLTFVYEARYDPQLASQVTTYLAGLAGGQTRQWAIPLRWLYPDAYFSFVTTGNLQLPIAASDLRTNETAPVVQAVSLLVATDGSKPPSGLTVALTPPGKAATKGTTGGDGSITSQGGGSPWAGLTGGSLLGTWELAAAPADNAGWVTDAALDLSALVNLVLVVDYSYTPRA